MKEDIFLIMLLEYMLNTHNRLEKDYQLVKNRVSFHDLNADDYYDLLVCQTRLDYTSFLFRQIRELIDVYY